MHFLNSRRRTVVDRCCRLCIERCCRRRRETSTTSTVGVVLARAVEEQLGVVGIDVIGGVVSVEAVAATAKSEQRQRRRPRWRQRRRSNREGENREDTRRCASPRAVPRDPMSAPFAVFLGFQGDSARFFLCLVFLAFSKRDCFRDHIFAILSCFEYMGRLCNKA